MNRDNNNLENDANSSGSRNVKGTSASNQNIKKPSQNKQLPDYRNKGTPNSNIKGAGTQNNMLNSDDGDDTKDTKDKKNSKNSKNSKKKDKSELTKEERKKIRKTRRRRGCLAFFVMVLFFITVVVFLGAGLLLRILDETPELSLISVEPNVYTSIVYDKDGVEIDRFHGDENREYMTLDNISDYLKYAAVAVEDQRFYEHIGIDPKGIIRAGYTTIKNKITNQSGVFGASTITQQLIKNNVTKVTRNSLTTKVQELYLAVTYEKRLEQQFGNKTLAKDYILELYLNTIGLGHGYNGVEAASLGYFNKEAKDLTIAESACIIAITNNPTFYSPRNNPENNWSRVEKILGDMLEQNLITRYEYQMALEDDIYSRVSDGNAENKIEGNIIHSYFEDAVFEQVSKDLQEQHNLSKTQANILIYNGGLQIYTTKDTAMQQKIDETYNDMSLFPDVVYAYDVTYTVSVLDTSTDKQEHKDYKQFVQTVEEGETFVANKRAEIEAGLTSTQSIVADATSYSIQPQSSMVIMDYRTGYVTAIAGGRGEKVVNRGFNRATDSMRQPGSVFKVLAAFAPAVDTGIIMPGSIIVDEPITIGNYSPSNWYGENYRGPSTAREGVEQSMNIISVKIMDMVGVDTAYNYLLNFGFTTLENDNHLSTALGGITYGVTQLEVTAAYGAIANEGKYYEPTFYTQVLDHDGNVLLDNTLREPTQIIKESTAFMLTDMMTGVITSGTGTAAKLTAVNMPVAGKTGTTQETKDLTFVGYTPYYVAGIWLGYDRYDTVVPNMMSYINGRRVIANDSFHLRIWKSAMEKIHEGLPTTTLQQKPVDVISMTVCGYSGNLVSGGCTDKVTDYFLSGTEPTQYCNSHSQLSICSLTNLLANQSCGDYTVRRYASSSSPVTFCAVHSSSNPGTITTQTTTQEQVEEDLDSFLEDLEDLGDLDGVLGELEDLDGLGVPDIDDSLNNNNNNSDNNINNNVFDNLFNDNDDNNNGNVEVTTQATTQETTQQIQQETTQLQTESPITTTEAQMQTDTTSPAPITTTTQTTTQAPITETTTQSEPAFTLP